ncbi:MAG: lytic transglycosylase [Gammaproteobacteria bacterium]|nr:lytic transglycosylase [Gammaproteobacteria bacterium]
MAWGAKVSPECKAKVIKICANLGINPDFLMTCMAFETGEMFSPDMKNNAGSSGTGLIQFMKATAEDELKTSTKKLAAMSAAKQPDYVEEYFKKRIKVYKQLNTLEDVYFAILNPIGIGKKDNDVIFTEGVKNGGYIPNKGLDKDQDGKITVAEVASKIRYMYHKGLKQGYLG